MVEFELFPQPEIQKKANEILETITISEDIKAIIFIVKGKDSISYKVGEEISKVLGIPSLAVHESIEVKPLNKKMLRKYIKDLGRIYRGI